MRYLFTEQNEKLEHYFSFYNVPQPCHRVAVLRCNSYSISITFLSLSAQIPGNHVSNNPNDFLCAIYPDTNL